MIDCYERIARSWIYRFSTARLADALRFIVHEEGRWQLRRCGAATIECNITLKPPTDSGGATATDPVQD